MIEEDAYVSAIADGEVWIEKQPQSACASCSQVCASASVSKALPNRSVRLSVSSGLALNPGDHVIIGMAEAAVLQASFLVYLLPLLAFFVGALGVQYLTELEWAGALGGLLALILCYVGLKTTRLLSRDGFKPVVLRKID